MKTIAYNIPEEIKAVVLVMILSLAVIISKAQTLPNQPTLESFTANISAPENTLATSNNGSAVESVNTELVSELKLMISSGSYWNPENTADQNKNLTDLLTDWIKKGQYWEENQNTGIELDPQAIAGLEGE